MLLGDKGWWRGSWRLLSTEGGETPWWSRRTREWELWA
ncbi:hypothetical protein BMQ_pBM30036 (plasmid) [Priestia megaterium QM B1551]|uniref:Uncharacterized protein n=1 Tax=Priestia megaterium (strain ATCC 12872 / QMB1551) TaxID=545693 RepID=D5E3C3_PRIM1|nr:hypothetical protein BMQ_pBM30036 [Priestia megaterium QM B1551]